MNIDQTTNARYGRLTLSLSMVFNAVLLIGTCVALWVFNARANSHGIPPSTTVGFRSQHTLASLHGWYVAQRVGFHFAAVASTSVTVIVFAIVALAFVRRSNPMWMLFVPVIGELVIAGCFVAAGHRADNAALSIEKAAAFGAPSAAERTPGLNTSQDLFAGG